MYDIVLSFKRWYGFPVNPAGRTVLVTGGASGIGAAIATAFVDVGDHVTVFDRGRSENPAVSSVAGDVRSYADNERAIDTAAPEGHLDVLIANAGVHDGGVRLLDADAADLEARFRAVLDIDVLGYLLAARAAAGSLKRARGCIVATLSDASFDVHGNGAGIAYVAAKHAGVGLVRALARDLAPDVRVNAVAPGGVATPLTAVDTAGAERRVIPDAEGLEASLSRRTLLAHGARLAELSGTYLYLCSEAAGAITGQVLRVDGGLIP
jgi:NAD(P)-dependent dehydrogenase (short-subunit alcohol dehydrogenase family)